MNVSTKKYIDKLYLKIKGVNKFEYYCLEDFEKIIVVDPFRKYVAAFYEYNTLMYSLGWLRYMDYSEEYNKIKFNLKSVSISYIEKHYPHCFREIKQLL